jgi:CBS domain-containing protein
MAETGLTHFPIVGRGPDRRLLGMISLEDLLKARASNLEAERRREQVMQVRVAFPFAFGRWSPNQPGNR